MGAMPASPRYRILTAILVIIAILGCVFTASVVLPGIGNAVSAIGKGELPCLLGCEDAKNEAQLKDQGFGEVEDEGLQTTTQCNVSNIDEFDTDIITDWTDGAPNMSWVDLVQIDGYNQLVLIQGEAGNSIDIVANVSGLSWHVTGEQADVTCFANERAEGKEVYRLYVGSNNPPEGWSTTFPSGVEMKTFDYFAHEGIQEAIEPGTADTFSVELGSHTVTNESLWINGQFWNPNLGDQAYHFAVSPGYKLTSPTMQGTYWVWTQVFDQTQLLLRFTQTVTEVQYRDDPPTILKFYCGARGEGPQSWLTVMPDDWTCETP